MAVVVLAENPALTAEMYDGMQQGIRPLLEKAPGFIAHAAWWTPEGLRIVELWHTQRDANRFFAEHVHPHIPADKRPKRTVLDVHALVEQALVPPALVQPALVQPA